MVELTENQRKWMVVVVEGAVVVMSKVGKAAGPFCVLLAFCLFSSSAFCNLFYIAPYHTSNPTDPTAFSFILLLHWITTCWLLYNVFYNYYHCITTSPGYAPIVRIAKEHYEKRHLYINYCNKCDSIKPERAHHCSICNRCILKMDHHCPWMANCVGHYNHKFFVLFLFYTAIGCIYLACNTLPLFIQLRNREAREMMVAPAAMVSFLFFLGLAVAVSVGLMLVWHIYLVLSAQTTIEFYNNRLDRNYLLSQGKLWFNSFDLGTRKNFYSVFGANSLWLKWMLPTAKPPTGDGIIWEKNPLSNVTHEV